MVEPSSVMLGLLVNLATEAGMGGLKHLLARPDLVQEAAQETDRAFGGEYEQLTPRLVRWVEGGELIDFVLTAYETNDNSIAVAVAESFVDSADFMMSTKEHTLLHATRILQDFFRRLSSQLFRSEQGLEFHDQKMERRLSDLKLEIREGLSNLQAASDLTSDGAVQELLDDRRFATAREVLERKLGKDEANAANAATLAALGLCYLELGESGRAEEALRRSMKLKEKPSTKALLGLTLLAKDVTDREGLEIAEQFRNAPPEHRYQFALRLKSAFIEEDVGELIAVNELGGIDARGSRLVGQWLLALGELELAEDVLACALAAQPEDPVGIIQLAVVKLLSSTPSEGAAPRFSWSISAFEREVLSETISDVENAVKSLDARECPSVFRQALMVGAHLSDLVGDRERAISFARELQRTAPDEAAGWLIEGRILRRSGSPDESVAALRKAVELDPANDSARLELAKATLESAPAGRKRSLEEHLPELARLRDSVAPHIAAEAYALSLLSLRANGESEVADKLVAELEKRVTQFVGFSTVYALDLMRQERGEEALELLAEVEKEFDEQSVTVARLERGRIAYWCEDFSQAASALSHSARRSGDANLMSMLADSLYRVGRGDEAHALAEEFLADGPYDRKLARLKAQVEWEIRDLESLRKTHELIESEEPDELRPKLNLITLLLSDGHEAEAAGYADDGLLVVDSGDGLDRIRLAHLLARLGDPRAREIGYQAAREFPQDLEVQQSFIHLTLFLGEEPEPAEVTDGTAVKVRQSTNTHSWILDSTVEAPLRPDELLPGSQMWDSLLGLKLGEAVKLGDDENTSHFEVVEIVPKTTALVRQAFVALGAQFAGESSMKRVPVGENYVNIFMQADQRATHVAQTLSAYSEASFPLNLASTLISGDLVQTWLSLSTPGLKNGIFGSRGTDAESKRERLALESAQVLVLSTTGFLIAEKLKLLASLIQTFDRIVAPQTVISNLRHSREMSTTHAGQAFFGKVDGEYVFQEYPEQYFVEMHALFQKMIESANRYVEFLPVWERARIAPSDMEELRTLDAAIGIAATDAAMIANKESWLVYEDDMLAREGLAAKWKVPVASTQSLLSHLLRIGALSEDEFFERTGTLVRTGYQYVRVTADFLEWLTRNPSGEARQTFSAAIDYLDAKRCSMESAVAVAAQTVRYLWIDAYTLERRHSTIDEFVVVLATHGNEALRAFEEAIRNAFGPLLYLQRVEALKALRDRWELLV